MTDDPVDVVVMTETFGHVLLITLHRPAALNAIDTAVAQGLLAAGALLDDDPELAVGVLTGAGRGFCSGMDLKAFAGNGTPKGLHDFYANGTVKPLICAVEGFALAGGLELALTCDLVVAAKDAKFGIPESSVGLFAAGGALLRLPRRVPLGLAMELALTADPITAEDAHRAGLVNRVTEPGAAVVAAMELAERIGRNAPLAVAASKQLLQQAAAVTDAEFWELQRAHFRTVFRSEDAKEGPRAFAEKRPPAWTGT